jgi:hypothetical protein
MKEALSGASLSLNRQIVKMSIETGAKRSFNEVLTRSHLTFLCLCNSVYTLSEQRSFTKKAVFLFFPKKNLHILIFFRTFAADFEKHIRT